MFYLYITIQVIGLIILFYEFYYTYNQPTTKEQTLVTLFMVSTIMNTFGYLLELLATTEEAAITAVKFTYLGKVYVLYTMFLFLVNYSGLKFPKSGKILLFLIHTFVFGLVATCNYHTLFYKSYTYTYDGIFPHLVIEHGIFYILYTIVIGSYMLIMPLLCLYKFRTIKTSVERRQLLNIFIICLIPMIGFFILSTGITGGYDTTAVCYIISSIIMFFTISRHNLFDTLTAAKDKVIENIKTGIVVTDEESNLLYYNAPAASIYPELADSNPQKTILDLLIWSDNGDYRFIGNKVFTSYRQDILSGEIVRGKMVIIDDITANYRYTKNLEHDVAEKTRSIKEIQTSVITSFADMIEARDGATGQHVKRTSAYVQMLTMTLKERGYFKYELTDKFIYDVISAAPLHDIGKISIPDSILCKPGKLSPDEFEVIKTHTTIGAQIIEEIVKSVEDDDYLTTARDIAHYHHEKWNGKGYPTGLSGEAIPLSARIMAICDVYEALISKRCYKTAMPIEKAISIIREESGESFDPDITKVFLEIIDEINKF